MNIVKKIIFKTLFSKNRNKNISYNTPDLKQQLFVLSQNIPVCAMCEETVWVEAEDFCAITRYSHKNKETSAYGELYHASCFVSMAGQETYERMVKQKPPERKCVSCPTKISEYAIFCQNCLKTKNPKIVSNVAGVNRCTRCNYNSKLPNTPYCQQCFDYWYNKQ